MGEGGEPTGGEPGSPESLAVPQGPQGKTRRIWSAVAELPGAG